MTLSIAKSIRNWRKDVKREKSCSI